jgi:hypothetical protein
MNMNFQRVWQETKCKPTLLPCKATMLSAARKKATGCDNPAERHKLTPYAGLARQLQWALMMIRLGRIF